MTAQAPAPLPPLESWVQRARRRRRRLQALIVALIVPALLFVMVGDEAHQSASTAGIIGGPGRIGLPVEGPKSGILISREQIAALPTSGPAWQALLDEANTISGPDLANQDSNDDVETLARALVYARTGETRYLNRVVRTLHKVMGTERGGRTLALARNLSGYVIAADLIDLGKVDPTFDHDKFRPWLRRVIDRPMADNRSLVQMQGDKGNNWGAHAGAALAAAYAYLGDAAGLAQTARIVHGFLGDTSAWYGWQYEGPLDWACGPRPPPINPVSCSDAGNPTSGVIQQDQIRGCGFSWPPCREEYVWESLQGLTLSAELLARRGYPTWRWGDEALLRSVQWLYGSASYHPTGDDTWIPWLINARYGTDFPAQTPTEPGKNFGFADWLFARR